MLELDADADADADKTEAEAVECLVCMDGVDVGGCGVDAQVEEHA